MSFVLSPPCNWFTEMERACARRRRTAIRHFASVLSWTAVGGGNPIVVEVRPLLRVRRFLTWEDFHRQKTCDRDSSSSCAYPFTRGSGSSVDCASGSLTQLVMMQTFDERHLDHLSTVR